MFGRKWLKSACSIFCVKYFCHWNNVAKKHDVDVMTQAQLHPVRWDIYVFQILCISSQLYLIIIQIITWTWEYGSVHREWSCPFVWDCKDSSTEKKKLNPLDLDALCHLWQSWLPHNKLYRNWNFHLSVCHACQVVPVQFFFLRCMLKLWPKPNNLFIYLWEIEM